MGDDQAASSLSIAVVFDHSFTHFLMLFNVNSLCFEVFLRFRSVADLAPYSVLPLPDDIPIHLMGGDNHCWMEHFSKRHGILPL
ncbi:hypothetical protein Y032_0724g1853 [Ancylostoma ceylanicum]|uniref:Uncharacterized protein n=1 Tax=Ancylostoma ceylanicum TaxID=53326 RepID=A0A016WER7_9BILA|nr:hypothetical protein Y032_0724g1853 [Ancylostoma ceylanicum]